jgi:hypothetical protein
LILFGNIHNWDYNQRDARQTHVNIVHDVYTPAGLPVLGHIPDAANKFLTLALEKRVVLRRLAYPVHMEREKYSLVCHLQ